MRKCFELSQAYCQHRSHFLVARLLEAMSVPGEAPHEVGAAAGLTPRKRGKWES